MRLNLLLSLFILSVYPSLAQNLLPNPGFEQYKKKPKSTSQLDRVKYWLNPDHSDDEHPGTPDFYYGKGNIIEEMSDLKKYFPDLQVYPFEGNAIAGIIALGAHGNAHEYLTTPLTKKILKGDTVRVAFYFTNGKGKAFGCGMTKLGTYFSKEMPSVYEKTVYGRPQTEMEEPLFSNEWKLYTKEFIAEDEYNFMTIGNFKDYSQASLQRGSNTCYYGDWAYYFIDGCDVRTTPDKPPVQQKMSTSTTAESKLVFQDEEITLKKGATIVLKNILFNSASPVILSSSYEELDKLVTLLKDNPALSIEISGHTDNLGDPRKDQELSEQRAKNVMAYVVNKGISEKRLSASGYGMTKPIADNGTTEGRAKNRRVEFTVK